MKDIDVSKLDWSQLDVDASTLSGGPAAKTPPARTAAGEAMIWSEQNGPNGASAVSAQAHGTLCGFQDWFLRSHPIPCIHGPYDGGPGPHQL